MALLERRSLDKNSFICYWPVNVVETFETDIAGLGSFILKNAIASKIKNIGKSIKPTITMNVIALKKSNSPTAPIINVSERAASSVNERLTKTATITPITQNTPMNGNHSSRAAFGNSKMYLTMI